MGTEPTAPIMPTPMTPEHLQLLSTRHLTAAAERVSDSDETSTRDDGGLARMARFELRRRACSVPVNHRYASVRLREAETK